MNFERIEFDIDGAFAVKLDDHSDARGSLTEFYRADWSLIFPPLVHFSFTRGRAHVMRGLRLHVRHSEVLVGASGSMQLGLVDLRTASPTYRNTALCEMRDDVTVAAFVPAGVGHALYSMTETLVLQGRSANYDPGDEHACRWDDAGLGMVWNVESPLLSPSDASAQSLASLERLLRKQS